MKWGSNRVAECEPSRKKFKFAQRFLIQWTSASMIFSLGGAK